MKLYRNSHSVFSLHYHLVLVVKYRRKVINNQVSERLREIFHKVGKTHRVEIEAWNHDIDHIHVMFRAEPKISMSQFLDSYKSASSRLIKKEYPFIRKYLWKEMFWSPSYCLLSTGGATMEVIRSYIANQGESKKEG